MATVLGLPEVPPAAAWCLPVTQRQLVGVTPWGRAGLAALWIGTLAGLGCGFPSPRKEPCRLGGAASQGLPPGWLAWRELLGLSWQGGLELPSGGAVPHTYGGTGAGCSPLCLNYGVRPMGTTTPSMPWSQAVGMGGSVACWEL